MAPARPSSPAGTLAAGAASMPGNDGDARVASNEADGAVLSRRNLLRLAAATQLWLRFAPAASAEPLSGSASGPTLGPAEPFSFDALKRRAAAMAASPYVAPPRPAPAVVGRIDYDVSRAVRFPPERALHADGPYPVRLLPVGLLFPKSVRVYALDGDAAREVLYAPGDFIAPPGSPLRELSRDPSPFAGFELRQAADEPALREHEGWASFLGGSYFRAVGEANQYGLSARGLAQDSGGAAPEEFPDFTHFWIAEGKGDGDPIEVYALLDGPSLAGAYRFAMHRGRAVTMDISCELHLRRPIERLGIAPLTSMYWFSETAKPTAADWRPAVHDSDGLLMLTGGGEWLWRPLIDPPSLQLSVFPDERPRGFGLMQRDRTYDHYLDAVAYERRPCAFVEPRGDWGRGSVQLVEIPTGNEVYDNIVAMWVPAEPNAAGQALRFDYRLTWRDEAPETDGLARCVATRLGMGGAPGAPRSTRLRKFLLEFAGPALAALGEGEVPEPVLAASRGTFSNILAEPSPDGRRELWRARFDLDPRGSEPIELRACLRFADRMLTETWAYRYIPFASLDR